MKYQKPIKIISSGKYLPQKVSASELEMKFPQLPKGFAESNSGVKYRHQGTFESIAFMGARAIEQALKNASLELSDIDLLIAAGASFDFPLPSQSSVIKHELADGKNVHMHTFDVDATCLSFVSAFEIAAKMLDGEQYKKIVIVSSEMSTKGLNTQNPETLTLFGDGAAAFILGYEENSHSSFVKAYFKTYSEGVFHTVIKGGGYVNHFRNNTYEESLFSFEMNGVQMLKLAKKTLPDFMEMVLQDLSISLEEFDAIVPHQASKIGIQLFQKLFGLSNEQVKSNLEEYGNCIAASIPLLLHDSIANNEIKRGDLCMLFGTSAGFSIGCLVFVY
jgi:3-oxoacyl-[acyl-carrier-protein] synthase III